MPAIFGWQVTPQILNLNMVNVFFHYTETNQLCILIEWPLYDGENGLCIDIPSEQSGSVKVLLFLY